MPTYLLHGFRWPRPLIRIHIILQNLDDAAAEWLVAPPTTRTLLRNFNALYPDCMEHLNQLRFVEQYDPNDTTPSQPYAYVADLVEEVKLGVAVDDVVSKGIGNEQWAAMMELRDKLAPEEKVSWYVVVCGDEERWTPTPPDMMAGTAPSGSPSPERGGSGASDYTGGSRTKPPPPQSEEDAGRMKKLFGSMNIGKRKSRMLLPDLERSKSYSSLSQNAPEPIMGSRPMLPNTAAWQSQQPTGVAVHGAQPASAVSSNGRSSHVSNISNGDSSNASNPNSTTPPSSQAAADMRPEPKELLPSNRASRADLTRGDASASRAARRATTGSKQDIPPERSIPSEQPPTNANPETAANLDQVSKRFAVDPDSRQRGPARRNSNVPAFSNSPHSHSPRATSPEHVRRAYSPVSMIRSPVDNASSIPRNNGAMSPVSTLRNEGVMRSASPLRSEYNTANPSTYTTARSSPAPTIRSPAQIVSANAAYLRDSNAFASQVQQAQHVRQAHENALAALQGETAQPVPTNSSSPKKIHPSALQPGLQSQQQQKPKQRLSLVTHVPAPPTVPEEAEEVEGEYERVIALSPVASTPIVSYRRSRASMQGLPGNGSSSTLHLSGMNLTRNEGDRPYFGQAVDHRELVATGIENAFDRL